MTESLQIKDLGQQAYEQTWAQMQAYTRDRDSQSADQIWLVEHPPVFTQGQAGKAEHVLDPGDIPIVQSDRGGQVTYHGPGQIVAYNLIDLRRKNYTIRHLVSTLENAVIATLADFNIAAKSRCDAPGVYVDAAKICSLGLRVKRGCSYHGLALNVDMDLQPFTRINPCGFRQLSMTQMRDFDETITIDAVKHKLLEQLRAQID